jgi:hypothetical protein
MGGGRRRPHAGDVQRHHLTRTAVVALTAWSLTAAPALASGGTGGGGTGGGGGGGGTATDPGTTSGKAPCVQISGLAPLADQSVVTDGAMLDASASVSRCGGNNTSFTVRISAVGPDGVDVLASTQTWFPQSNLSWGARATTEGAAFGTTYAVTVQVVVPETGAVVATASRSVSTPAARIADCATVANQGGTAGYYPGSTTNGALWLSYSVKDCGGREWLDTTLTVLDATSGAVVRSYPQSSIVGGGQSTGVGLIDVEPVPTGTPYTVVVEAHRHSTGDRLDSSSLALTTPPAK